MEPGEASFAIFDHTADLGITVRAPTLEKLFETAGEAFCELISDPEKIETEISRKIELTRDNTPALLQSFLSELLFYFDAEHELYPNVTVDSLSDNKLVARVSGNKIDPAEQDIRAGIKAVTYHQLTVEEVGEEWRARVIFDV